MTFVDSAELVIAEATGQTAEIVSTRPVGGGSICVCNIITLRDKREFFIKSITNAAAYPGMFSAESRGLTLLTATSTLRVPRPVAFDRDFLVLEVFRETPRPPDWEETFGRQLAALHQLTQTDRCGFEMDNYLGRTLQPNQWSDNWQEFWVVNRLGWQLQLYARTADKEDRLLQLGHRLIQRIDRYLGEITEPAVLLHGDLWSGNAAADEHGAPVVYDPACYYGQREAEIGMMRMFGGFGPHCEAAYAEIWPFSPGSEERIRLYRLYHELNHLNLFGAGYYQGCIDSMTGLI